MAPAPASPVARTDPRHALLYGPPATVAEQVAEVKAMSVGGLILNFRLGPMSYDDTARSLTLFAQKVATAL